jgi:hypothetical protein
MFSTDWQSSPREHEVTIERDVAIRMEDGVTLDADVFRPKGSGKFPAILAFSPYDKAEQSAALMPEAFTATRGSIEAGDHNFYVRRGYAFVVGNIRGSWKSGGLFGNLDPDPRAVKDLYEAVEWAARQQWCDGNVGMTGVSYFSMLQKRLAHLKPPHLKCLFAPYGFSDAYRDLIYRGGILAPGFVEYWCRRYRPNYRIENTLKKRWGESRYNQKIEEMLADPELQQYPNLIGALRNPDAGANPMICEYLLNPLYNEFYAERVAKWPERDAVPAYFGADWGLYGLHLRGDVRAYEHWNGPKKLTIGPPLYLDRPLYQMAYESLRWFDHWLKGIDTGMMDEKPVQLFILNTGEWKESDSWPVKGTKWTPFFLHEKGLLSEHEFWPSESPTSFFESQYEHGTALFRTPPMVEATELCGPIVLDLFGSTTDTELLWFASLWEEAPDGKETLLTRGWLRGSQRRLDAKESKPWRPVHLHTEREPLKPDEITHFSIEVGPLGVLLRPGHRLVLRIRSTDDEPPSSFIERIGQGHIRRPGAARVTIHHDGAHPSHLLLPITRGNRLGTFISGGKLPPFQPPPGA